MCNRPTGPQVLPVASDVIRECPADARDGRRPHIRPAGTVQNYPISNRPEDLMWQKPLITVASLVTGASLFLADGSTGNGETPGASGGLRQTEQTEPRQEFIFTSAPFESCHASTIVETSPGELMAAWFAGSAEGNPDVAIWGSHRSGGQWSEPVELVREPEIATYNPVLFFTTDGLLWLYYKFGPHPTSWTAGRLFSRDLGKTWSEKEHLPAGIYGPVRTKPLLLGDGTVVSGTSVETYRAWSVWIERSKDNGRTWSKSGPITVPASMAGPGVAGDAPPEVPGSSDWKYTEGIIQPSVVSLGGKWLRLYARSTSLVGKVCVADSSDGGVTWTQARPIDVPNPNSGIDAVTLEDGRVILVYNHTDSGRSPLNLAVSRDGENFRMFHALEDRPGEYSYPAMIQGSEGDLHVTYTWNRETIRYVRVPLSSIPE